ncbi:RIO kinase 1 [Rugosimonospora acidiphila]|uniref:non-specific serine/threonine protein kinase n=1 Tax=Rugosimonospora acidiphila TaxID=556531 RepID=A0ABP9S704_9ACTN
MRDDDDVRAGRGRRRGFDDDEPRTLRRPPRRAPETIDPEELPETGDRWSTWDQSQAGERGPQPYPDWLVTELAAVDYELGVVKTGKEADVDLVRRAVPGTDRECLLAAKRYRASEHRMFHRDAGYLEGRRVRESRVNRAMAKRTGFGREAIAGQWAAAEFAALCRLWEVGHQFGVRIVPYPVQILGTELLLEFLGTPDGEAAPRLAQVRPDGDELADLWRQAVDGLTVLARCGLAHGDLSPYNILVHDGQLVLIDLPQVVDVVGNPRGPEYLARDVRNVAAWFTARGLPGVDGDELTRELLREAGMR